MLVQDLMLQRAAGGPDPEQRGELEPIGRKTHDRGPHGIHAVTLDRLLPSLEALSQRIEQAGVGGSRHTVYLSSTLLAVASLSHADHGHTPVRTAQSRKSHVMRPSTARAVTASLQVISTWSWSIVLIPLVLR